VEWYVQRKPEVRGGKPPPIASLSTISITCFDLESILGICSERSVTKSLNHTMTEVSCRMPLSIQENSRVVPCLFYDCFFSNSSFTIHHTIVTSCRLISCRHHKINHRRRNYVLFSRSRPAGIWHHIAWYVGHLKCQ
jgi:hypothetical protein